jgi:uncharacterized protein (TIGR00730 family)
MKKVKKRIAPPKAYSNVDFLNSPDARTIRMLSEFLEPRKRFRDEHISDTIVFFGSARVLSPKIAKHNLNLIKRTLNNKKVLPKTDQQKLDKANIDLEMSKYYHDAEKLTYLLTRWSQNLNNKMHFVVCSGGGPGIMEAANKGARMAGGKSIGLNISLPFEQAPNRYISKNLSFEFHYFFMRKFWFVYLAKAMIMFPGGFGTFDELFEVITLLQTKKVTKPLPVILYGKKYWNRIIDFKEMVKLGTISQKDLNLIKFFDTPEETFNYLKRKLIKIIHN